MGWVEFQAFIAAMNRQQEAPTVSPDSWDGAESDAWWVEARAERARDRGR